MAQQPESEIMPDKTRIKAEFTITRNGQEFKVRFTPIKGRWWNVSIHEMNDHLIKHVQREFPPNFTNATKVLDEWVPKKQSKPKRIRHRFKVVG